jgi:hypothetical protein
MHKGPTFHLIAPVIYGFLEVLANFSRYLCLLWATCPVTGQHKFFDPAIAAFVTTSGWVHLNESSAVPSMHEVSNELLPFGSDFANREREELAVKP